MIPRMLRSDRYETGGRLERAEAVRLYEERWREIDLVILDMMMPGMTGSDTFRALRAIHPGAPRPALVGIQHRRRGAGILDEGAMGFIQKPFLVAELEAAIAEIVDA
jgi:DNA-binding response OmpR family regulator